MAMTYDMQLSQEIAKRLPDDRQSTSVLLRVIGEIREALGVGGKPMLAELPEIVRERCRKEITMFLPEDDSPDTEAECINCGEWIRIGDNFCFECGAQIIWKPQVKVSADATYCPECSHDLEKGDDYCKGCGAKIIWEE
jgi:DNA-directed RNA polymerase subunit RPC12/RpoP